jgi:hypothetical protein
MAAGALARADQAWLARLITRRVPLARWSEALEHRAGDIKVIIELTWRNAARVSAFVLGRANRSPGAAAAQAQPSATLQRCRTD